jgi:hypothetical protein
MLRQVHHTLSTSTLHRSYGCPIATVVIATDAVLAEASNSMHPNHCNHAISKLRQSIPMLACTR